MTVEDDGIAAALVVGLEAALVSREEAIRIVDWEIERRPSPDLWLVEASLATSTQDLLSILRDRAAGHPLLTEVWPLLAAMERSLAGGADPLVVADQVKKVHPFGSWPRHLGRFFYDVYEEATCAHAHDGVPQPLRVANALQALFRAGRDRRPWQDLIERVLALKSGAVEQ